MKYTPQSIPEVLLLEPKVYGDERGYFTETFRQDLFEELLGFEINFIQDNESKSAKGVLRGLHYQLPPFSQAKLVRVVDGSILDVVVDIRKNSSNFGRHLSVKLTSDNKRQLFIPKGFAHGFIVLSETAIFSYKVDNYYSAAHEQGLAFNDPELGINWQVDIKDIKLSDKDNKYPKLSDAIYLL